MTAPMSEKLRWGVLSTAKIAREKLIPALRKSQFNEVVALASRDASQATKTAESLGIPHAFGDYDELLQSDTVDVIYIPLPNHLHVPWAIRAIEAGKHVLCEKPISLDTDDAAPLLRAVAENPGVKVMEAFMYRFHPQWSLAKQLLDEGRIGKINSIHAMFTFFNKDPENVRNKPGIGGGSLLDVGCYCVSSCRYLLGREPARVIGSLNIDSTFGIDGSANGLLDFGEVRTSFYCSMQSEPSQRVYVSGEKGSITLEFPFYQPDDCAARVIIHHDRVSEIIETEVCDHYSLQVDALARSILDDTPVPTPLSDAVANMRVLEAIFTSNKQAGWVTVA